MAGKHINTAGLHAAWTCPRTGKASITAPKESEHDAQNGLNRII